DNTLDGVLIQDSDTTDAFISSFTDLMIRDSLLGEASNGTSAFTGNGLNGFEALDSSLTGFTLKNSQLVGNGDTGVAFDRVTAQDVTFKNDKIAANLGDGVFIAESEVSDFTVQDSYL